MAREDLHPTDHLRKVMKERDVTWGEVIDVVNYYDNAYGPDEKGRMTYQKGDLCVVADGQGGIVTVLLRQTKQWTNEDARNRRNGQLEIQRAQQRLKQQPQPKPHSHYRRKKKQKKGNNHG